MNGDRALQDLYAPESRCFGCGPANDKGLRIKSVPSGDEVLADFTPEAHHEAFPGMMNGGIIGALLDCHSNWTAAHYLMTSRWGRERPQTPADCVGLEARGESAPPCTVTADFHVTLRRPTPMKPVHLVAKVVSAEGDRVVVEATLACDGKVTATCKGTFVAVKEGHPAFHRW